MTKKPTAKQMRLDICTDVIYQVKDRKAYVPLMGNGYIVARGSRPNHPLSYSASRRRHISEMIEEWDERDGVVECEVCAVGALFASALGFGYDGEAPASASASFDDVVAGLRGVFSRRQIGLMEEAFEGLIERRSGPDVARARKFGATYADATSRIVAIMQNVLDNDGTFKP